MKKILMLAVLSCILLLSVVLIGCSKDGNETDTSETNDTQVTSLSEDTTTADESSSDDESSAEEGTTVERFDYFAENMDKYVTLSKESYESIPVTINKQYRVDDAAVEEYINYGYTAEELESNMGKTYIMESALYTKIMNFLDKRLEITYS